MCKTREHANVERATLSTAPAIPSAAGKPNPQPALGVGQSTPLRLFFFKPLMEREPLAQTIRHFNPWHDIPTGAHRAGMSPRSSRFRPTSATSTSSTRSSALFRLDRVLYSAVHYPGDYGFIPRTLGDDGDPLDILVADDHPGLHRLPRGSPADRAFSPGGSGSADEKVLAVPLGDPYAAEMRDLNDMPPHYLKEIEHFFQVYKDLEGSRRRPVASRAPPRRDRQSSSRSGAMR